MTTITAIASLMPSSISERQSPPARTSRSRQVVNSAALTLCSTACAKAASSRQYEINTWRIILLKRAAFRNPFPEVRRFDYIPTFFPPKPVWVEDEAGPHSEPLAVARSGDGCQSLVQPIAGEAGVE